jgi:hypothetical protein
VRRGPREPSIRTHHLSALRDLLDNHSKAIVLHNRFAKSHNKRFEGKHERFHLPVLIDFETERAGLSNKNEVAQMQKQTQELNRRDTNNVDILAMQLDGATDIEMDRIPLLADEPETSILAAEESQLSDFLNKRTAPTKRMSRCRTRIQD